MPDIKGSDNLIGFYNTTEIDMDEIMKRVEVVLQSVCQKENVGKVLFDVILVDNPYIQGLNQQYRGIDRPTDVITFALEDEKKMVPLQEVRVLGDIYISIDKALEQAESYGHSPLREFAFLAVHGFYHLLGYDHQTEEEEKIMFQKQEEVLDENNIKR